MTEQVDPNAYTTSFNFTKSIHRDPYPAILSSNPSNSQKGKIILITGGGTGIGAAVALVWARASAAGIIIAGRRVDKLEEVASNVKAINGETKVLSVRTDVSNEDDVKNLFQQTRATFGRVPDVLLLSHRILGEAALIGETPVDAWWGYLSINLKVYTLLYITTSTPKPTLLNLQIPSYSIGKLAGQRLSEYVHASYPTLRIFITMPGVTITDPPPENSRAYALNHADLTDMLALYLSQPRADFLRDSTISVNWDVEEMEKYKEEILEKKLLQLSWLQILPTKGWKGT